MCGILSDNHSLGESKFFYLIKIDNNNDFKQFQYNKNLENMPTSSVTPDLKVKSKIENPRRELRNIPIPRASSMPSYLSEFLFRS